MQFDISKLNTVQIQSYDITNVDPVLYGVFPTMIKNKCDAVKYDIVDEFQLSNLSAVGFEDDLYYFYYKIRTRDDIITNIKVDPSQKIKFVVDIDKNFKIYPFLFSEPEINICIFYNKNETTEQFKISYTGYNLNHRLKQQIISEHRNPIPYIKFSHIGKPLIQDYSNIYCTIHN